MNFTIRTIHISFVRENCNNNCRGSEQFQKLQHFYLLNSKETYAKYPTVYSKPCKVTMQTHVAE